MDEEEWQRFIQNVMGRWGSIKDPLTNRPLNAHPHWRKQRTGSMQRLKSRDYLKQEYREFSKEFKTQLGTIAVKGRCNLQDAFDVFGNDNILGIIADA